MRGFLRVGAGRGRGCGGSARTSCSPTIAVHSRIHCSATCTSHAPSTESSTSRCGPSRSSPSPGRSIPRKAQTLWEAVRRTGRRVVSATSHSRESRPSSGWTARAILPAGSRRSRCRRGVTVAAVLGDGVEEHPAIATVRFEPTFTPEELDEAWRLFGPEFALDPEDPWSADELAARERAVARARGEDDPGRLAHALRGLGRHLRERGREREGLTLLEDAVEVHRDSSTPARAVGGLRRGPPLGATRCAPARRPRAAARDDDERADALQRLVPLRIGRNDERAIDDAAEVVRLRREAGGSELVLALAALATALDALGRGAGLGCTLRGGPRARRASSATRP